MLHRIFTLTLLVFLFHGILFSQEESQASLRSPHNTVYTHLFYLQEDSYQPATAARVIPPGRDSAKAVQLAIKLKQILDGKGLFVHLNRIPSDPNYTDSLTNRQIYVLFPKELPEIYLEKTNSNWYYSEETTSKIPDLHRSVYPFGSDRLLNWIPEKAHQKFAGIKIWQYLGIVCLIIISIIIHFFLSRIIRWLFNHIKYTKVDLSEASQKNLFQAARYLSLVFILSFLRTLAPILQLSIEYSEFLQKGLRIAITIFLILFALSLLKLIVKRARILADKTESKMDEQLLPIVSALLKIALILVGAFHILYLLEVNVTALIAGISIGGLALALAAQDTVKNLIGSVIIFVDKPFLVGDYITGSGFEGTVEEVGFRTTRLRGIDTAIVNIPNGHIVNVVQKNLGFRKMRMMGSTLGLTYDTAPEKIEAFIQGLQEIIQNEDKIHQEIYYVHFIEYADSSLNIMFRVYLLSEDYAEELKLKHKINMQILKLSEEVGVSFAFPSRSLYIEQMPDSK